jgi:holo-[acyl-carrier protein] synthase
MIFGIGLDVVSVERIAAAYARHGELFARRILMPEELAFFRPDKRPQRFLAMRFAGKEAVAKALCTGFAHGIWVRDIGIVQNARGRPEVIYSPRGRAVCRELGAGESFVSLTDEAGLVMAIAVVERAP